MGTAHLPEHNTGMSQETAKNEFAQIQTHYPRYNARSHFSVTRFAVRAPAYLRTILYDRGLQYEF